MASLAGIGAATFLKGMVKALRCVASSTIARKAAAKPRLRLGGRGGHGGKARDPEDHSEPKKPLDRPCVPLPHVTTPPLVFPMRCPCGPVVTEASPGFFPILPQIDGMMAGRPSRRRVNLGPSSTDSPSRGMVRKKE